MYMKSTGNQALLSFIMLMLMSVLTSCSHPSQENILITDIEPADLPKLDYKTSVGYAIFEGVFCRVMYENGAFVFKDFQNRQIWPCMTGKIENVCWNAVGAAGQKRIGEKVKKTYSVGIFHYISIEYELPTDPNAPLTPFIKADIGDISFSPEQKFQPIIQYPDRISFPQYGDVAYTTNYRFERLVSSPLRFNGKDIIVNSYSQKTLVTDVATNESVRVSQFGSYFDCVGVLRNEKEDYLVVMKSLTYGGSYIFIYNRKFEEIISKRLKGRFYTLVEGPNNSLIAYHRSDYDKFDGLKISVK